MKIEFDHWSLNIELDPFTHPSTKIYSFLNHQSEISNSKKWPLKPAFCFSNRNCTHFVFFKYMVFKLFFL